MPSRSARPFGVAGQADFLGSSGNQHNLAILGRGVAGVALPSGERHMGEARHQLLAWRLVRIMTAQAIRCGERLSMVRLDKSCILRVMTVETECRSVLGQVEIKLALTALSGLVGHVAGIAAHVQRCVTAAFLRDIDSDFVASQTQVCILAVAAQGFMQLVLIV